VDVQIVRRGQCEFAQTFVRRAKRACPVNLSLQAFDTNLPACGISSSSWDTVYEVTSL